MDFYQTVMGKRFYEATMPKLVKAIEENTSSKNYLDALIKEEHEKVEVLRDINDTLNKILVQMQYLR